MVVAPRARRAGLFSCAAAAASGSAQQAWSQVVCRRRFRGSDETQGGHISAEPRINERIRVPEVRLVGPAGEQVGIVSIDDALRLAQEADLDLVEVAPTARPPVCKLMDYGKFKYESALKARESRKNQAQTVIKEIKLRPKIDPHDYGTKRGHVERFLKAGDKVKVTIMFRGREQSRPELGFRLLQRLAGDVEELGFVEAQPKQDGRNMTMVIGPHRRKSDARAERPAHPQAERSHPERPERSPQSERAPQARPTPAPARPTPARPTQAPARPTPAPARPVPARPAQAQPGQDQPAQAQPAPAQPGQDQPAQAQPVATQPAPQPAERAPAARPVPGPRAVHAAAARRANGGQQGARQPGQEVSAG
jgi:translation initiation factor IF-3